MRNTKTVLVVDDDMHIRRAAELKLKIAGYNVVTARDGREGVETIIRECPDAVITDINMPFLTGRELCELTNDLKAERPFLTIVLTARIMPGESEWIANMHETVFMEKPFSPTALLALVDNYFAQSDE